MTVYVSLRWKDKVIWEEWIIPVIVNSAKATAGDGHISSLITARYTENLKLRLMDIIILLNEGVDHVPAVKPEENPREESLSFEVSCAPRSEQREATKARSISIPPAKSQFGGVKIWTLCK